MIQPNMDYLASKVEEGVNQGQYPKKVYTYMSVERMDRIEDIFQKCALWYSYPKDLNDPFDCRVYPDVPSNEQLAEYLIENAANVLPAEHDMIKGGIDSLGAKELTRKAIDDIINSYGIKCFTSKPDNLLMWSHYGNAHTGICLEFNVLQDCQFFVNPIVVDYKKEYPHILFTDKRFITTLLETKSIDWHYENEFRVYKKRNGYHDFKSEALCSVIFGCKTTDKNIHHIIKVVRSNVNLNHVQFYKAIPDEREFKLNFVKLL